MMRTTTKLNSTTRCLRMDFAPVCTYRIRSSPGREINGDTAYNRSEDRSVASTTTRLMTFAEYELVPNPPGGRYELHHGELVSVPFPKIPHVRAQWQLRRL